LARSSRSSVSSIQGDVGIGGQAGYSSVTRLGLLGDDGPRTVCAADQVLGLQLVMASRNVLRDTERLAASYPLGWQPAPRPQHTVAIQPLDVLPASSTAVHAGAARHRREGRERPGGLPGERGQGGHRRVPVR